MNYIDKKVEEVYNQMTPMGEYEAKDFRRIIKQAFKDCQKRTREEVVEIIEDMERGGLLNEEQDLIREATIVEIINKIKELKS